MKLKNIQRYDYDPNVVGSVIATAECDYYNFHVKIVVETYYENIMNVSISQRKGFVYNKGKNKPMCTLEFTFDEQRYGKIKENNGYNFDFVHYMLLETLDCGYEVYQKQKKKKRKRFV